MFKKANIKLSFKEVPKQGLSAKKRGWCLKLQNGEINRRNGECIQESIFLAAEDCIPVQN